MSLAIDTNVLVRLLTADDEKQSELAVTLIRNAYDDGMPVFISLGVLLETEWVLRSRYGLPRDAVHHAFTRLLETVELELEAPTTVEEALRLFQSEPASDFADCMHVAVALHSGRTLATFDKRAARLAGAVLVTADG